MLLFFTIAAAGLAYVLLTSVHGHDLAHDISHDDLGHDGDQAGGHIASILSPRVVAMFMMGFGATAGVARFYNLSYPLCCLAGLAAGVSVGALMYYMLEFFVRQQANSLIDTQSLVGNFGTVAVGIEGNQPGEVAVSFAGRYATYVARSHGGEKIGKGSRVVVVETVGSDLIVEPA
jgi:membrane protein implicated in regulation of membrane protease activity